MKFKFYFTFVLFFAIKVIFYHKHTTCVASQFYVNGRHRTKRSTTSFKIPQPTLEFPLVLFAGDDYNNGTEGVIHRSRAGEYRVWAQTTQTDIQKFTYRSLLVLPGWKLTFQACCASGNSWSASVSNVSNISSLHYFMFDNLKIGEGIFYTRWLHWIQKFSVKVDPCENCTKNLTTCTPQCYFGSCGLDGTCQCKDGYLGDQCEKRPTNAEMYPSLAYPLILFPKASFQGNPVKVSPDVYHEFAKNSETQKTFSYLSARVLFTRSVSFSRDQENDQVYKVSPGSDIQNLELFFASNMDFGTPLWFNYATTIDSTFYIKVADNSQCTNCSEEGGSCYTGQCVCLPGYNGTFCEQKI